MSEFKISKPWVYEDNWLIFPDTVFSEMDLTDCNDTVKGICTTGQTFDQCIKSCASSGDECGAGYFIEHEDGNICVPIHTGIHKFLNPAFRLRNKSIYPVMKNMNVKTFIDRSIFDFPPNIPNATFYQDPFFLQNVESKTSVELPETNQLDITRIEFSNKNVNIQLLPIKNTMYTNQVYIPVRHADTVIINIPGTSLIMRKNLNDDFIGWVPRLSAVEESQNTFKIHSVQNNEILNYNEDIYLTYQDLYIVEYDAEANAIKTVYSSYSDAKANGLNITFRLKPNIMVYYCKDSKCNTVQLKDTDAKNLEARYDGQMVSRNPACWGMCDKKPNRAIWILLLIVVIVGIIVLVKA